MEFHTCDGPDSRPARRTAVSARGKMRTIDIHCHLSVPEAAALAAPHFRPDLDPNSRHISEVSAALNHRLSADLKPKLSNIEVKLADMDRLGIDMQVLSPAPPQYYYWADPELGLATSRLINDRIAQVVADHPDRFAGFATIPMQSPELAVRELRRAVGELGLRGVELCTNVVGAELSDPRFAPVFAAAADFGVVIFLHPLGFSHGERLSSHYLNNVIGNPLESAVAISHLIFGGVLDRHPGLKMCVAHGGGYLPSYSGRMDHAYRAREDCRGCANLPSSYLKKMFFDTVVFDREQLLQLVKTYGADRVLMGSDYPFDMGEQDPVGFVTETSGLSQLEVSAILGGNAMRLLGLTCEDHPSISKDEGAAHASAGNKS